MNIQVLNLDCRSIRCYKGACHSCSVTFYFIEHTFSTDILTLRYRTHCTSVSKEKTFNRSHQSKYPLQKTIAVDSPRGSRVSNAVHYLVPTPLLSAPCLPINACHATKTSIARTRQDSIIENGFLLPLSIITCI